MTVRNIKPVDAHEPATKLRGKCALPIIATTSPKQIADPIDSHQILLGIFLPQKLGKLAKSINMIKVRKDIFILRICSKADKLLCAAHQYYSFF
jgi:hypothetical protein